MIEFHCTKCGMKLSAPDDLLGTLVRCPCGGEVKVPLPAQFAHGRGFPPRNRVKPFASGHTRAVAVVVIFCVIIFIDIVAVASGYAETRLLSAAQAGEEITEAQAETNDNRQAIIGIIQTLAILISIVFFLIWIHRAHKNLPALGAGRLTFTPGWAVGWFFIPFFNLFRPYQVATEIWKASDPEVTADCSWQTKASGSLVGWWWALFLISSFLSNIAGRMALRGGETLPDLIRSSWVMLVSDGVDIPAAVITIFLVLTINRRQEEKNVILTTSSE